jgi:hypothetical protein
VQAAVAAALREARKSVVKATVIYADSEQIMPLSPREKSDAQIHHRMRRPDDIILIGMRAIKSAIKDNNRLAFVDFTDGSLWVVNKTKTGYSARTAGSK